MSRTTKTIPRRPSRIKRIATNSSALNLPPFFSEFSGWDSGWDSGAEEGDSGKEEGVEGVDSSGIDGVAEEEFSGLDSS